MQTTHNHDVVEYLLHNFKQTHRKLLGSGQMFGE